MINNLVLRKLSKRLDDTRLVCVRKQEVLRIMLLISIFVGNPKIGFFASRNACDSWATDRIVKQRVQVLPIVILAFLPTFFSVLARSLLFMVKSTRELFVFGRPTDKFVIGRASRCKSLLRSAHFPRCLLFPQHFPGRKCQNGRAIDFGKGSARDFSTIYPHSKQYVA